MNTDNYPIAAMHKAIRHAQDRALEKKHRLAMRDEILELMSGSRKHYEVVDLMQRIQDEIKV